MAKHKRIHKKPAVENANAEEGSAAPEVGENGAEEERLLEPNVPRLEGESEEDEANARESSGTIRRRPSALATEKLAAAGTLFKGFLRASCPLPCHTAVRPRGEVENM